MAIENAVSRGDFTPAFSPQTLLLGALAALTLLAGPAPAAPVSVSSLLRDMVAMESMCEFPSPAYTCKQFSSYDRAAKSPGENWFANGDLGQFLRVEESGGRKEHVMADMQGPGAIVRIWSANPEGTIRIYIDGATQPQIEAPMSELLGGKFPGLARPLAGEYSKGWNLYFPIPYARSCKVTSDKGGFYYHVNYRTYEPGTEVESFRRDLLSTLKGEIEKVSAALAQPGSVKSPPSARVEDIDLTLGPGQAERQEFSGPLAITRAAIRVNAANLEEALRGVVIRMRFDGEECVEVPLGDFFGSAPGINAFESLPLGMRKSGELYANWVMPFRNGALIEAENFTGQDVQITGELTLAPYTWTERSMHFHSGWRTQWDVPTRPMIDWNYLTAKGRGVFAGVSFAIDNPVSDWWGEGDEKIYVDGEKFPADFGTGTEDYYGYAWCWPDLFSHAYHSQSRCDGPRNYGRTSVNRFHILDRIPFRDSFVFDMELWHWHQTCRVNMAVTTYWYARPGGTAAYKPVARADAKVRPMPPYTPLKVKGAIEGESMRIVQADGKAEPQDWGNVSGDQHLWWHVGVKPGATLTLGFPVETAGKFKVYGRFLSAKDYGIHQLSINGVAAGPPIDFFSRDVVPTDERELGVFELNAGENRLTVKAVGANPQAVRDLMFGLDYLLLRKAP